MTSVTARARLHAFQFSPGDGDGARGGGLIDLDPGARRACCRLMVSPPRAATRRPSPWDSPRASEPVEETDTSVPRHVRPSADPPRVGRDVDATPCRGPLMEHLVDARRLRDVLVDGDVRAALSGRPLMVSPPLPMTRPTRPGGRRRRFVAASMRGRLAGTRRTSMDGRRRAGTSRRTSPHLSGGSSEVAGGTPASVLRRLGLGFSHRGGCRAMRVPGRTSVRSAGGRESVGGLKSAVAKGIECVEFRDAARRTRRARKYRGRGRGQRRRRGRDGGDPQARASTHEAEVDRGTPSGDRPRAGTQADGEARVTTTTRRACAFGRTCAEGARVKDGDAESPHYVGAPCPDVERRDARRSLQWARRRRSARHRAARAPSCGAALVHRCPEKASLKMPKRKRKVPK